MEVFVMERNLEWEEFVGSFDDWVAQMELEQQQFEAWLQQSAEVACEN
jgi:hypothetical protein